MRTGRTPTSSARAPAGSAISAVVQGLVLIALLAQGPALAANEVTLSVEPAAVQAGEQAVVTVSVEGASRLSQGPNLVHPPEVELQSAGQSTNVSIINGRMSRSISFNYVVYADKPGEYILGPAEVRDGDRLLRSGTAKLVVVSAAAPPATRAGSRGGVGGAPGPSGSVDVGEGNQAIFARSVVDKDHVRLGEQITLRFRVYRRIDVPVLDVNLNSIPSTEGFWREDLPPERTTSATINGQPYDVSELVYAIFPTQAGKLEIGSGQVECIVQERGRASRDPFDMFGMFPQQRRVRLTSRPVAIRVDPLPEPKPSDFTGGVGSFRVRASCEPAQVAQNEPVTLTIIVEGTGNASTVGDPELPRLPGVRSYPSGADVQTSSRGDVVGGTKTFKVMLVPENTGRREVPPIRFSVYDPERNAYVRLETPSLAFQVVPGGTGGSSSGEVARIGRDLRAIRDGSRLARYGSAEPWRGAGYWALQLLPLVLIAGGFAWRLRRERREADWGRVLSRGAPGRLQRDLQKLSRETPLDTSGAYARLDAIVERYFTDRFHLPVRGMTRDELAEELKRRGAGEDPVAKIRALLDRCDFARFAPGTQSSGDLSELISLAASLPEELERTVRKRAQEGRDRSTAVLLLALGLGAGLGLPSGRAEATISRADATAALSRGNEAYRGGDFGQALREYGSIAHGGRESADLYLNLGNASYRYGLLGWSVYFFERGRRLSPGDPDLRANLEIVQQETKDRIPETGGSRFLAGLVSLEARSSMRDTLRWLLAASWLFALWAALRLALGEPPSGLAKTGYRVLGIVLGVSLAFTLALTLLRAGQSWTAPNAVVVADECPVRSNPESEATVEFTLHAGTLVRVGRETHGFREVLFSDKLRGWGSSDALALLGVGRPVDLPRIARVEEP